MTEGMRYQALMTVSMKITAFWDISPVFWMMEATGLYATVTQFF
jgi:hypothetical protein